MNIEVWFKRPGHPSSLIPNEGIPQQCRTSAAVTITRICVWVGNTTRLSHLIILKLLALDHHLVSYKHRS
jgi:hypothetical protein